MFESPAAKNPWRKRYAHLRVQRHTSFRRPESPPSVIFSSENHGKTMGKPWENHGKTMGKPWENHGETMIQWLSDYLVMFSDYLWFPKETRVLFEVPFLMGCSCAVLQYHCLCLEVFVFRARHAESFTDATHEQDILRHHGRLKGRPSGNIGEWRGAILGGAYTWFRKSTSATFRNFFSLGSTLWSMKHFMLRRVQNCRDEHIATCLCTLGRWCHKSFQSCCWSSSDVAMENPQLFNNL